MAYEIVIRKRFTNKVTRTLQYLEKEWSEKIARDFLLKIDRRIHQLQKQPYLGAPSEKVTGVRGILVSKHNKLFYKIKGNQVIILNIYDTRINPTRKIY